MVRSKYRTELIIVLFAHHRTIALEQTTNDGETRQGNHNIGLAFIHILLGDETFVDCIGQCITEQESQFLQTLDVYARFDWQHCLHIIVLKRHKQAVKVFQSTNEFSRQFRPERKKNIREEY